MVPRLETKKYPDEDYWRKEGDLYQGILMVIRSLMIKKDISIKFPFERAICSL